MLTRTELIEHLLAWGATDIDYAPDKTNSVSSQVIRCRYDGRRTMAVASDTSTETCIGACLDLLDMQLHEGHTYAGAPVATDQVTLIVADRASSEALDAIGSILAALTSPLTVAVLTAQDSSPPEQIQLGAADFSQSAKAGDYLTLMQNLNTGPPELLLSIHTRVGRPELRAYPQLTSNPWWSLRLEGLEVGRFRPNSGWLDVGKAGPTGNIGPARKAWQEATAASSRLDVSPDPTSIEAAVRALSAFADAWLPAAGHATTGRQNEHALESRILRGHCPIVADSTELQLMQPDPVTNWGSQFPTRWGFTTGNAARYLDALLRDGDVPWAVEMKVQGGGGVGQYYRHAIGQAVLYRHFIRSADPLDPWFAARGLTRTKCKAAVVIPDLNDRPRWRPRLQALCDLLDVSLIEVPHHYAALG